ncbi:hypothetical protein JG688_00008098 [Phytophthora aleatoria]|uniref:Uncharacterized protein n=1 Tax=Phytophthora aleatoria TaxID=2496075 RepID=A0A8J5M7L9_9STRA|nr:hypothetical protein JG688_00008098 [Phytophthora aleatoria]
MNQSQDQCATINSSSDASLNETQNVDADSKQSSTCRFCAKIFATRALANHQNRCKANKGKPKQVQAYKFCILNESVFEHILSFLTNQALTKLQMITGDRYPDCKPQLARYCCKCENDNPVILHKKVAKEQYGVKDISAIPCQDRRSNTPYDRVALENHMLASCGSKLGWLRVIAKRDIYKKQLDATKQRRERERHSFLESLATGFASYVESILWKETDEDVLGSASSRFVVLSGALEARGLRLRADSYICKEFIVWGYGNVSDVVDTMEEMHFLFAHTEYERVCAQRIKAIQDDWGGWLRRESTSVLIQTCREKLKAELCVDYLGDNRGLVLPQIWEKCRWRFEEVNSSSIEPRLKALYIFSGRGHP